MRLTLNNRAKQTLASVQRKKAMKFGCRVTRVTTENHVHTKEPQHQFFRLSRSIRVAHRYVRPHSYPPPDAPNPRLNRSLAASLPALYTTRVALANLASYKGGRDTSRNASEGNDREGNGRETNEHVGVDSM